MPFNNSKILNFSLDEKVVDNKSYVHRRILKYAELVERYDLICLTKNNIQIEIKNGFIYGIKRTIKIVDWFKLLIFSYKECSKNKYNILTVQDQYFIGLIGFIISKKFKLKLEIQIHGWEKVNFFRKIIAHFLINRADSIRVVSKRLQKQIVGKYKIDNNKIFVIPIIKDSIIDFQQNLFLKESKKSFSNEFIFLTAARLVKIKNIDLQIKAIKKLNDEGINAKLIIAGNGPEELNLKRLVNNLSISDKIIFLGWLDNLKDFYKKGDAFLLTSSSEGWGMVIVEAAQAGLPIIMTDVGCAQDFIINEENGLIIPVNNFDYLVRSMKRLIEDFDLRKKISIKAFEATKFLPSESDLLKLQIEIWQKLVNEKKIKLLILTQKVNIEDSILGFFHSWIEEFSKHCQEIIVICLEKGKYNLPDNVRVFSLGKEIGASPVKYIFNFYKIIWRERKKYDKVFVHMNPIYVIMGFIIWKLFRKKIGLWYAHGSVNNELRLAEVLTDLVFSSTASGFRIKSKKLKIVGQGIDVDKFTISPQLNGSVFNLIAIGRISPIKGYDIIIDCINLLKRFINPIKLTIIGGVVREEDKKYFEKLQKKIKDLELSSIINFIGPLSNDKIVYYLQKSDLMINASSTGSLDKVMLEAMSCGLPVVTCNESIKDVFCQDWKNYFFEKNNLQELVSKIRSLYFLKNDLSFKKYLRNIVIENHNLKNLIVKIITLYD